MRPVGSVAFETCTGRQGPALPVGPISVEQAQSIIMSLAAPLGTEAIPLAEAAGRVCAREVPADRDFPPYDRVTMDGAAIASAAWRQGARAFAVQGTQRAGAAPLRLRAPDRCIEVMTGAVLPAGCDAVIPVEQLERAGSELRAKAGVEVTAGRNVHRQGADRRTGDLLIRPGTRLLGAEIAVLASVGASRVPVARLPRVGVLATGDELVPVASRPLPHQVRMSNGWALAASLAAAGFGRLEVSTQPDDPGRLRRVLGRLLRRCDVLVTSGGVSAGQADYLPAVFEALGVRRLFHKVRQRPGMPFWFGAADGRAVFALPGNPVSVLVGLHRYVIPFLDRCSGIAPAVERARLAGPFNFDRPLTLFLPVRLESAPDGALVAHPATGNGSGDMASLLGTDGFVELPAERNEFAAGEAFPLTRWRR
jgi:molybdopterin molybdotransferase